MIRLLLLYQLHAKPKEFWCMMGYAYCHRHKLNVNDMLRPVILAIESVEARIQSTFLRNQFECLSTCLCNLERPMLDVFTPLETAESFVESFVENFSLLSF